MPHTRPSSSLLVLLVASLAGCTFPTYKFIKNEVPDEIDSGDVPSPDTSEPVLDTSSALDTAPGASSDTDPGDAQGGTVTALCSDGQKSGNETDIDCGGDTLCSRCAVGQRCSGPTDCATNSCVGGKCSQATCDDVAKNGTETDIDCGGSCPLKCANGKQCLAGTDCLNNSCIKSVCEAPSCTDLVKNGSETDADCGGIACPKCSVGKACIADGDCIDGLCRDGAVAGARVCKSAKCTNNEQDASESDVDCGGRECEKCSDGKRCDAPTDCASGVCGTNMRCSVPKCDDQVENGTETDVDCGGGCTTGSAPFRCSDYLECSVPNDCRSSVCTGGKCQPASCVDTLKNGDETDVDCGGKCAPCADTLGCDVERDCRSGVCDPLTKKCSVPSCTDSIKNGLETDLDCGGDVCRVTARCDDGKKCTVNEDCINARCLNRVCAAAQCTDQLLNGQETDVDCGGPFCGDCADNKTCLQGPDCVSGVCSGTPSTCQPAACPDGVQNQGETDLDCGGPNCAVKCTTGQACNSTADCAEGYMCPAGPASPSKVCTNEFQVIYQPVITTASSNLIKFNVSIRNNSKQSVLLSNFKLVYWFTRDTNETNITYTGRCSSTQISNGYCSFAFSAYSPVTPTADTMAILSLSSALDSNAQHGTIAPGGTSLQLPVSFDRGGSPTMSQTNDWSFSATALAGPWLHIGLLYGATPVWGELPQ